MNITTQLPVDVLLAIEREKIKYELYPELIPFDIDKALDSENYYITNNFRDDHRIISINIKKRKWWEFSKKSPLILDVFGGVVHCESHHDITGKPIKVFTYEKKWYNGGYQLYLCKKK